LRITYSSGIPAGRIKTKAPQVIAACGASYCMKTLINQRRSKIKKL
jgi:hypothetical protein